MRKRHSQEIARDLRALGGIPFYFIVAVRAVVGQYLIFIWQLVIAAAILLGIHFITKKMKQPTDMHIACAFVLCTFTSVFYQEAYYTIFAFALLGMILIASFYLKLKKSTILHGVIAGIMSSAVAYLVAPMI